MCLAVPGRIISVKGEEDLALGRTGTVDFQGSRVEVSLALVPEAREGSWVLVHAGFALSELDEEEARATWEWLAEAAGADVLPAEEGAPENRTESPSTDSGTARGVRSPGRNDP